MANRHLPDLWRRESLSPFRELNRMQRLFDRFFSDYPSPYESGLGYGEEPFAFSPPVNLEETDRHFLFSFDLPGLSKDNIHIEVKDNQLIVWGERKEEQREKTARHASERFYGSFQRVVTLPSSVDPEKVQANYKDGVLRIALPKAAESKAKPVEITEGSSDQFEKLLTPGESTPEGTQQKLEKKKEKAA